MRRALLIAVLLSWGLVSPARAQDQHADRLDLNQATLEELKALPISEAAAQGIFDYRYRVGYLQSVYELRHVESLTPAEIARLRPLVSTLPPESRDEAMQRYDNSFNQVQRYLSQEGASEELADEFLDRLRDPSDVNDLTLYELQSFQNISPIDAVAILKERDRVGRIESSRQLRGVDGLSFWGYRNLRDFVLYEAPETEWKLHGDLQLVSYDTPELRRSPDAGDLDLDFQDDVLTNPAVRMKLRLRLGRNWKAGAMTHRNVDEVRLDETRKAFLQYEGTSQRSLRLDRAIVGSFRVAFGQGLVMDNTDFFSPRKTGFGFNKRLNGIIGDVARSRVFALNGAAAEATWGPVHGIGFYSVGKKDGIVNADGSYNRYFVASRWVEDIINFSNENSDFTGSVERAVIDETVVGGNLKVELTPGTFVGVSGYEAQYDRPFDPQATELFSRPDLLQARDSELFNDYSTNLGVDDDGNDISVDFRRVVGAEFQTVYKNVALQGEYAKLDANPNGGFGGLFRNAPDAWILNSYVQYGDLNLLAIYRDYDLGFDNPYGRAFSNDTRYEQTLAGDPFRMNSDILSFISTETPQPKPERGLFLTTRYRVNRKFTITGLDFDQWTRVADQQDMRRWTLRMEYQPIFPLRFRVRHRMSSRSEFGTEDVRKFRGWETRLETRVRLSGFDELRLLYNTGSTHFAPRPRLSRNPVIGRNDNPYAQAASTGHALQGQLRHNVNQNLQVQFTSILYTGFTWYFEDNEFLLLDGEGLRNWFLIRSRLSDNLLLRFKVSHDQGLSRNNVEPRTLDNGPGVVEETGDVLSPGRDVRRKDTAFRIQLDYTF